MSDKDKASIPIIAMTANAFEEDKRDAIAAGMNGHIAKPIQVDKLLSILSEVIRKTGFGKTWIYKLISAGKFPKQIKIGDRAVAFIESEVDEWIYKAITASRNTSN